MTPSIILNRKTTFHKINENVVVEVPGKLIHQLIEVCDGVRSLDEIVQLLKIEWDERSVRDLVKELRQHNIVADSRFLSDTVWKAVENPSHFPSCITDSKVALLVQQARERHKGQSSDTVYYASQSSLSRILDRRRSIRFFSGHPCELQNIVDMLWSAYGELHASKNGGAATTHCRRTVPSAGALYPLMLHIVLFKDTEEIRQGIYSVWMGRPGTVGFNLVSENTNQIIRSFVHPLMLDGSHGVIVLSGSFHATGEKYGNRSMLYVVLEAGHAAQNVHMAATTSSVATVEIGGFVEELLAEALKLPTYYRPLTTVVFGHEGKVDTSNQKIEVQWAVPMVDQYQLPFSMALARVSDGTDRSWSGGKSISPHLAHMKAIAEAKEWAACGCVPHTLIHARFSDLETAVDPRHIIRFHPAQYRIKGFPFKPFSDDVEYAWVEGRDEFRGSKVHILADCVYFPYYPKTPRYTHANSSGVAAYPERQQAIKNGTLELVERDSFMIAYLTRLPFPTVVEKTLPKSIRERVNTLRKIGFTVWVKDLSIDLAPVVFIFVQHKEQSFTTCAACSSFEVEEALDHALMEVESAVWSRLKNSSSEKINPRRVWSAKDHATLYGQKAYFQKADSLVRGRNSIALKEVGRGVAWSWQELLDRFVVKGWPLVTVSLHLSVKFGGDSGLHIVRSIIPEMVPMSFGFRKEPCGMERVRTVAKEIGGISILYRDMTTFPHPFP